MQNDFDFANLTVLIIDDEAFMRQLISRVLNELGTTDIITAKNGAEGLKRVIETGIRLDVILCDLEMPGTGGLEFVRQLRASQNVVKPEIPVLIITGHSDEDNIKGAVQAGINGFLVKPISRTNLESRIKKSLKGVQIDPALVK